MQKMAIFICTSVLGWAGWWLGEQFSMTTAFVLSGIGTILGVFVGYRINRDYLS